MKINRLKTLYTIITILIQWASVYLMAVFGYTYILCLIIYKGSILGGLLIKFSNTLPYPITKEMGYGLLLGTLLSIASYVILFFWFASQGGIC